MLLCATRTAGNIYRHSLCWSGLVYITTIMCHVHLVMHNYIVKKLSCMSIKGSLTYHNNKTNLCNSDYIPWSIVLTAGTILMHISLYMYSVASFLYTWTTLRT